jgi:threonylcarbamoyladenosine tRNA methylthiotransferase MtaB
MRRRYTADHYRDLVLRIKESMPEACIGADVIVGFPGESDEHFEQTYDFLNSLPVSYLHVFTYSERENTPAASFSDIVPQERRKIRTARLRALSAAKRREFNKTAVGRTVAVIPESKNPTTGMWEGWSAEYVRVAFPYDGPLVQTPVEVLIDGLHPTDDDKVVGTFVGHAKTAKTGYIPLMV